MIGLKRVANFGLEYSKGITRLGLEYSIVWQHSPVEYIISEMHMQLFMFEKVKHAQTAEVISLMHSVELNKLL